MDSTSSASSRQLPAILDSDGAKLRAAIAESSADRDKLEHSLTPAEADTLTGCEKTIEAGCKSFIDVGAALATIRDERLYRQTHDSFERYVKEKWDFGRAHAYRLIEASATVPALSPIGDKPLCESHLRLLLQFPKGDRAAVWQEIERRLPVYEDGTKFVTAREIKRIVDEEIRTAQDGPFKSRRLEIKRAARAKQDAWHDKHPGCVRVAETKPAEQEDDTPATQKEIAAALEHAHAAIDCLKKIYPNNPYRGRAFEIVAVFMEHNR